MRKAPEVLRLLVLKDGPYWVAQCLEYDIAVSTRKLANLHQKFCETFARHIILALEEGKTPLANIKKAPKIFHDMFNQSHDEFPKPSMSKEVLPRVRHLTPEIPPVVMRAKSLSAKSLSAE